LNRYAYILNNPIKYTDPTGHYFDEGCGSGQSCELPPNEPDEIITDPDDNDGDGGQQQADITEWLVGTMDIEAWWISVYVDHDWKNRFFPYYPSHLNMFGDYGKYDIKRKMLNTIGPAVILCGGGGCRWVDYSTPGNIMYGYLSASREVQQPISWIAAGVLEYINSIEESHPYTGEISSWGDNPGDKAAVDFGYDLYEQYPNGITLEDFQIALSQEILNTFQSPSIVPSEPAYPAPDSGYPVDYFLWP